MLTTCLRVLAGPKWSRICGVCVKEVACERHRLVESLGRLFAWQGGPEAMEEDLQKVMVHRYYIKVRFLFSCEFFDQYIVEPSKCAKAHIIADFNCISLIGF